MTLAACRALVERGDPDRALVTRAAPEAAQAVLWPLYALNLEIARAPWVTAEPVIAEMRLQWWRDAVEEIGAGLTPRAHEVVGPLAAVIRGAGLPVDVLDRMILARRWDIYRAPFADMAEFEAHLQATAGDLMWLAARALGAAAAAEPVVRGFAHGAGLAAWLVAVPALEARGRLPLVDGRAAAVQDLARDGLARMAAARGGRRLVARAALPAMLTGWQATGILTQVVREPGRVAAGALGLAEFSRRGGLAWRGVTGRW